MEHASPPIAERASYGGPWPVRQIPSGFEQKQTEVASTSLCVHYGGQTVDVTYKSLSGLNFARYQDTIAVPCPLPSPLGSVSSWYNIAY